jgi:oxygen-dependent protoporphyrinogen oxidase
LFASLTGGLQTLVDRLLECLREPGCDLVLNTRVDTVVKAEGGGYTLALADGYRHFDQVVLALPAHAAAKVTKHLDQVLSYKLATIPYAGVATINVALRAEQLPDLPTAAGFVVPAVEGRTIIAATFGHHKYAGRAPEGHALLRAFIGGALHEQALERSDADLVDCTLRDLRDFLGLRGDPLFTRVHRWPKAMAQYVLGHGEGVQVIRARERHFPGFALVGNGYEGVGIPDLAAQADQAVDRLTGRDRSLPQPVRDAMTRATTA